MRRWPLLALAAMSVAVAATSTAIAATSDAVAATGAAASPPAAAPHAATPKAVDEPGRSSAATGSGSTVVSFRIAPQVLVQLDVSGQPWRVKTNTGTAPVSTDQLDAADSSGTPIPATDALKAALATAVWTGDWSAVGQWHAWPH